jgi:hypothetical protein
MSNTKEIVCELFGLPKSVIIFYDYGCALKTSILIHGRIFICDSHFCFYSNLFGMKKKVVINIDDLTNIEKKNNILYNEISLQLKGDF